VVAFQYLWNGLLLKGGALLEVHGIKRIEEFI
jgi:hypothetical protein